MTIGTDLIHVVDPHAVERARRLDFAVRQIAAGLKKCDIVSMLRERFQCSSKTAYRVAEMAFDLAGPTK